VQDGHGDDPREDRPGDGGKGREGDDHSAEARILGDMSLEKVQNLSVDGVAMLGHAIEKGNMHRMISHLMEDLSYGVSLVGEVIVRRVLDPLDLGLLAEIL
jgi:hypothetical protein